MSDLSPLWASKRTFALLVDQFGQRRLVVILEFLRFKLARLLHDDVLGQVEHVLGDLHVLDVVESDRPASWRMPSPKQMEKLAREWARDTGASTPDQPPPPEWWESVLTDPRAEGKPWLPIEQCRLSEVPRELLRLECLKCSRCIEIQRADAVRLYGPHAALKDVGTALLEHGCQARSGGHEDGCWPDWTR